MNSRKSKYSRRRNVTMTAQEEIAIEGFDAEILRDQLSRSCLVIGI